MKKVLDYFTTIEDFPEPGIQFRDITTVLQDAAGFQLAIDELAALVNPNEFDMILGIEARGFIFAPVLAYSMSKGFVPVRKANKLPRKTVQAAYALEYGEATIEMHLDAIKKGQRVLIVDDLLATGGTAKATAELVESVGGIVSGFAFLAELSYLDGRKNLKDYKISSVVTF